MYTVIGMDMTLDIDLQSVWKRMGRRHIVGSSGYRSRLVRDYGLRSRHAAFYAMCYRVFVRMDIKQRSIHI